MKRAKALPAAEKKKTLGTYWKFRGKCCFCLSENTAIFMMTVFVTWLNSLIYLIQWNHFFNANLIQGPGKNFGVFIFTQITGVKMNGFGRKYNEYTIRRLHGNGKLAWNHNHLTVVKKVEWRPWVAIRWCYKRKLYQNVHKKEGYKYLGGTSAKIMHKEMKQSIGKEYIRRVKLSFKSNLNARI